MKNKNRQSCGVTRKTAQTVGVIISRSPVVTHQSVSCGKLHLTQSIISHTGAESQRLYRKFYCNISAAFRHLYRTGTPPAESVLFVRTGGIVHALGMRILTAGAGHHNVFAAPRAVPFYDVAVFAAVPVIFFHDMSQPFGKIKLMPTAACGSPAVRLHTLLYPVKIFICRRRGYDVMKDISFSYAEAAENAVGYFSGNGASVKLAEFAQRQFKIKTGNILCKAG